MNKNDLGLYAVAAASVAVVGLGVLWFTTSKKDEPVQKKTPSKLVFLSEAASHVVGHYRKSPMTDADIYSTLKGFTHAFNTTHDTTYGVPEFAIVVEERNVKYKKIKLTLDEASLSSYLNLN